MGVFPHMVHVKSGFDAHGYCNFELIKARYTWLCAHVGERDITWRHPEHDKYMFCDADHAVQFSLIWCAQ
jgi:hypothetical protein